MAKWNRQQIQERAKGIIREHPGGIRYSELKKRILDETPGKFERLFG